MRFLVRHKCIIIPYILRNNRKHFVLIKDSRYDELSFVCGGKKLDESFIECANRELIEESNGIFDRILTLKDKPFHTFDTTNGKIKDNVNFTLRYHVFMKQVKNANYPSLFHQSSMKNDETNDLVVLTKREILGKKNVWDLVRKRILPII